MTDLPIHKSAYKGIFALCLGLLYFELFYVRVLAFVGGAHSIYLTIAFAMLGLASSSSAISMIRKDHWLLTSPKALAGVCYLTAWAVLIALVSTTFMKDLINARELAAIEEGGFMQLVNESSNISFFSILGLGIVASVVYFLFGAILSIIFRRARGGEFGKLYATDLLGACLGCVLSVIAMESFSYVGSAMLCILFPLIGGLAFAGESAATRWRAFVLNCICLLGVSWALAGYFEPQPLIQRLARDYQGNMTSQQDWRVWNSYGRISGITRTMANGAAEQVVVHGNGEGHATVPNEVGLGAGDKNLATLGIQPQRVLVLLAGAGLDMSVLDRDLGGTAEIVGVELVGDVFEQPLQRDLGTTRELLEKENVTMIRAEAREFLARDKSRYDLVLVSWSGASLSYHSGAASSAADYIYTKEALLELVEHLTPEGQLVLLNGNKIRHILALKEIFSEHDFPLPLKDSIVVTNSRGGNLGYWWDAWDNQRLLVRPSGFDAESIAEIEAQQQILYAPGRSGVGDDWYGRAVLEDSDEFIYGLVQIRAVDLSIVTDNRPFILDTFPVGYYFSSKFWEGKSDFPMWRLKKRHLQFVGIFSVVAVVLILAPLYFRPRRSELGARTKGAFLLYFGGIGAGFMFFEIAMISKLQMLIGHPGYVIAIVLASIIFFTGLGSLCVNYTVRRFRFTTQGLACGVVLLMGLTFLVFEQSRGSIVAFSFPVKCGIAFLLPALPCFLMGHMFPMGMRLLSSRDEALTPWALAVNGVAGTLASGMTLVLAQGFGYNLMIVMGCFCYMLTAVTLSSQSGKAT